MLSQLLQLPLKYYLFHALQHGTFISKEDNVFTINPHSYNMPD